MSSGPGGTLPCTRHFHHWMGTLPTCRGRPSTAPSGMQCFLRPSSSLPNEMQVGGRGNCVPRIRHVGQQQAPLGEITSEPGMTVCPANPPHVPASDGANGAPSPNGTSQRLHRPLAMQGGAGRGTRHSRNRLQGPVWNRANQQGMSPKDSSVVCTLTQPAVSLGSGSRCAFLR